MSEWAMVNEPTKEVTVQELDELVKELRAAREEYNIAKAISSEKNDVCEEIEGKLINLLTIAGKSSYELDKVARVTIVNRTSVTTPKTIEEKEILFAFLEKKFGKEGLMAYLSVNSATLNSLYNKELSESIEKQIDFEMGTVLSIPTISKVLQVRSK
jgi:hypothetical protein